MLAPTESPKSGAKLCLRVLAQLAVACPADAAVDRLVEAVFAPGFKAALLRAMAARGFAEGGAHLRVVPYSDVDQGVGLSLAPSPGPTPVPVPTIAPAVLAAALAARAAAERKAEAGGLLDAIGYR